MSGGNQWDPVDSMEPTASSMEQAAKDAALDMFKAILQRVLPPRGYGQMRRFEAGWRRMVVFVYEYAPEYFDGMSKRELAAHLGLTFRALMLEFEHARTILRTTGASASERPRGARGKVVKTATNLRQNLPGPPPGSPLDEVPRDLERSLDGGSQKIGS